MNLEKAANIVEFEFNKIAEDLSRREVKDTIKKNRSEYDKFRSGAKLNVGDRINRVFTTKEGFKNALGDQVYGTLLGTGAGLLSGGNPIVGTIGSYAPHVYRSNKRRTARANKELEKRYGDHAEQASKVRDVKRAFAQSIRNKQNQ